jgi:hypothetical protein
MGFENVTTCTHVQQTLYLAMKAAIHQQKSKQKTSRDVDIAKTMAQFPLATHIPTQ